MCVCVLCVVCCVLCVVCCVLCVVCCVLCVVCCVCVLCAVCSVLCVGNETDEIIVEYVLLSPGPEAGFLACFHIPDPDNICPILIARSLIPTLLWNNSQRLIEVIENGIPCGNHFDSRASTAANHLQFVWPTGSIQT